MYPILFQYKFIKIGGYGVMLGLAFYLAFMLLERELKIRGKDDELAYTMLLLIIPTAIIGSKVFHILENLDLFFRDPAEMIFSGAGLSVYGGFVFAIIASGIYLKKKGENFLEIADAAAPPMALGYGIGRIGCHVAGDGCYGIMTSSFLGVAYPNGIVPSTATVLPTPLFESFFSLMVLLFLLQFRKREMPAGRIFFLYLILNGIPRFFVEFVRLNPKIMFDLTQAQMVSMLFVITGIIGMVKTGRPSQRGSG